MPTHKITNEFIRKYNKAFAIKRYSKLPISEKIALVRKHVDKVGGAMKTEWDGIMGSSKTKVPKGSHKMPDGSIMKDSAMKKKPVYKLKSPRPVGAVARPNRKNRPGAPNSGALGGLTEPKFKSTPKYTLAQKGPSAITMTRKPPSSTMKIVKAPPTVNTSKPVPEDQYERARRELKERSAADPVSWSLPPIFRSVNTPLNITKSPKIKTAIKEFLIEGDVLVHAGTARRWNTNTIKLPSKPLQAYTKKALISFGFHSGVKRVEDVIKQYNKLPQNMKDNLGLLLYGFYPELHKKYSNLKVPLEAVRDGKEYYRLYNP